MLVLVKAKIVVAIIGIFENSLVAVAIWKSNRIKNSNNILIANLAVADILVLAVVVPLRLFNLYHVNFSFSTCEKVFAIDLLFIFLTRILFVCVSVERCFAVRWPFIYAQYADVSFAMKITGAAFCLSAVFASFPMMFWGNAEDTDYRSCSFLSVVPLSYIFCINVMTLYVIPMILIIAIYTYITTVIRRHEVTIKSQSHMQKNQKKMQGNIKMMICAVSCHFILQFPLRLHDSVLYFTNDGPLWGQSTIMYRWATFMSTSVSLVNPFIYASNKSIRREIATTLCCGKFSGHEIFWYLTSLTNDTYSKLMSFVENSEEQTGSVAAERTGSLTSKQRGSLTSKTETTKEQRGSLTSKSESTKEQSVSKLQRDEAKSDHLSIANSSAATSSNKPEENDKISKSTYQQSNISSHETTISSSIKSAFTIHY